MNVYADSGSAGDPHRRVRPAPLSEGGGHPAGRSWVAFGNGLINEVDQADGPGRF